MSSFLKAALAAKVEATVVYFTPEGNPRGEAQIATNRGEGGAARALRVLHQYETKYVLDGAKALHELCQRKIMERPVSCASASTPWDKLSDAGKNAHIAAASVIVEAVVKAMPQEAGNPPSGLVI